MKTVYIELPKGVEEISFKGVIYRDKKLEGTDHFIKRLGQEIVVSKELEASGEVVSNERDSRKTREKQFPDPD